jgi:DHA2 family metal-tetracycline-proton antiporter-like MFS transporter
MKDPFAVADDRTLKKITVALSFIIFFSVLNGTTFQIAVPDISAEFALLPSGVSWVMTAYILVFAIGALIYGKLANLYQVRNLITLGLILMCAGSIVGLLSTDYLILITARVLQAAGGAAIPALALIVVTRYIPSGRRGRVLGVIASTVVMAAGLGPLLGGFISGTFHWRYLFLLSMITLCAIPVLRKYLPRDENNYSTLFDTAGALLITGGASCLLIFVTRGVVWLLPAGIILLSWFVNHIMKKDDPFIAPDIFLNHAFRNTVVTSFLAIGTVFGMMFMVPIMLREVNGLTANHIGLVMFPGAMSAVIVGILGGRLSDRKGSGFVVYLGAALLASGFLLLSVFAGQKALIISIILIVSYSGFALLQSALPHAVSRELSLQESGTGMGIYNLLFFISGAFSTALIGRLLDIRSAGICINPLNTCQQGWIYSNIFIMLSSIVATATVLFYFTFRGRS